MTCYICFGIIKQNITVLPCNHKFHSTCLFKIRRPLCPTCRAEIKNIEHEILNNILRNQQKDLEIEQIKEELDVTLAQLAEYQKIITSITIPLAKKIP